MTWTDEAKAIVQTHEWRWRPGMRSLHEDLGGGRVVGVRPSGHHYVLMGVNEHLGFRLADEGYPDLADRPTVGALQGEIEEICQERGLIVSFTQTGQWQHCWIRADPDAEEPNHEYEDESEGVFDCTSNDVGKGLVALRALTWLHEKETSNERSREDG